MKTTKDLAREYLDDACNHVCDHTEAKLVALLDAREKEVGEAAALIGIGAVLESLRNLHRAIVMQKKLRGAWKDAPAVQLDALIRKLEKHHGAQVSS